MKRRELLLGAASLSAWSCIERPAIAETRLGNAKLTSVSDGSLMLPGNFIFEAMPEEQLNKILAEYGQEREILTPECNLALYQDEDRYILFDVGSGPDFMSTAGSITDSLEAIGLVPEDITHVVFTHAHPDHIWGLLDDFDDPLFYEASYYMGRKEWDYWWDPNTVNEIGEARAAFAAGAKRRMEVIADQVNLFDDGQEILPGIAAFSTPGHTPGHMSFEIKNGSETTMVLGDAIGNHHVAFEKPGWPSGSDQDFAQGIESRKKLFDRITSETMKIIGFHLPNGGIGFVERNGDGFKYLPETSQ